MSGLRRVTDELAALDRPQLRMEQGTVVTVTPGGAADGNSLAVVSWRGTNVACPYPSTYTPVVGHVVLLLIDPPRVVIVARLIGTPA